MFGKKSNASTASSAVSSAASSAASSSAAVNPLEMKLSGDNVPEKFQGKTVQELLTIQKDTETKRAHAEAEAKQWLRYVQEGNLEGPKKKEDEVDPADILDADAMKAINMITSKAVKPLVDALGGMQKQYLSDTREDFAKFEERADEVFAGMAAEHKFHPKYGYNFAFNLARAEAMDTKPKKTTLEPAPTKKGTTPPAEEPLNDEQKKYAKMMGLTEEKYKEFMTEKDPLGDQV